MKYLFWLSCIVVAYLGCCAISFCMPTDTKVQTTVSHIDTNYIVRFDTIPQTIICIDTAITSANWQGNKVFWIKGYEVITSDLVATIHVAYLDEKKRPIKYIGLMTK